MTEPNAASASSPSGSGSPETPTTASAAPFLRLALTYDAILAGAIAIVGGAIGFAVAGPAGLVSALIAAGLTVVYFGLTAATILLASRVAKGELFSTTFFAIVLGGWLAKLVVFLLLVILLGRAEFIDPYVFFVTIVVGVLGSLTADVLAFQKARVPYVSDIELPSAPDEP